jgi:hypothetical protein
LNGIRGMVVKEKERDEVSFGRGKVCWDQNDTPDGGNPG